MVAPLSASLQTPSTSSLPTRSSNYIGDEGNEMKRSEFITITVVMSGMESVNLKVRTSMSVCNMYGMMCKKQNLTPLSNESFLFTFNGSGLHSRCEVTLEET